MKLRALHVSNLGAITNVALEFGPGLNILYGPNDLGKSTLVESIRLALLLPHTSNYCESYLPWGGAGDPIVDLTFETEPQRIYRVRKVFGKSGSSLLQESKDGRDFDKLASGRGVDGELRNILRWGIAPPGGSGGSKGLPASFLATALLSTQSDVDKILHESLQVDSSATGKERITAALQAVAHDRLFASILESAQERRDCAYTDKGAKKAGRDSVFRIASERLKAAREEKEELERKVAESLGTEKQLDMLRTQRIEKENALGEASEELAEIQQLAKQAAVCSAAADEVSRAQQEVSRIQKLGAAVQQAQTVALAMAKRVTETETAVTAVRQREAEAAEGLKRAEETVRSESADPNFNEDLLRKNLELRNATAERSAADARRRIEHAAAAQKLVDAADEAQRANLKQKEQAEHAKALGSEAAKQEGAANEELQHCDVLARALDLHVATKREEHARTAVANESKLRTQFDTVKSEHDARVQQRQAFTVPKASEFPRMRRLDTDLAASQRAIELGLLVTVAPEGAIDLTISKDGAGATSTSTAQPLQIEADRELELSIPGVATLHVQAGRRQAQEDVKILQDRWKQEVTPHFAAAGVVDMDGLEKKLDEARELDGLITAAATKIDSLQRELKSFSRAADELRDAIHHLDACQASLKADDKSFEQLLPAVKKLGADPNTALKERRRKASLQADAARTAANKAAIELSLAEDRARTLEAAHAEAVRKRDDQLTAFPAGIAAELKAAQAELDAALAAQKQVAKELSSLNRSVEERKKRIEAALASAKQEREQVKAALSAAEKAYLDANKDHAAAVAKLEAARNQHEAENLAAAQARLNEVLAKRAVLPTPARLVTASEVAAAEAKHKSLGFEVQRVANEIHKAQGALEHVAGAVARERLRDAVEAFERAEQMEKETEAEYEAWKLLLEQMKEADAAQASNLGQVLAPKLATRFEELTAKRYETVCLDPHLGTQGVFVTGEVRDTERISVGTREQLSTLYRLCLAEYLQTMIVLDDQLVQSDETRMDWFRALLSDKSRNFQIIVFTCRPSDYLESKAMPKSGKMHADSNGGFTRAIDLGRSLCS